MNNLMRRLLPTVETTLVQRGDGEWVSFKECLPPMGEEVIYLHHGIGREPQIGENCQMGKMLRLPNKNILDKYEECTFWTKLPKGIS